MPEQETVRLPTYETLLTEAIKSLVTDAGMVSSPALAGTNMLNDSSKNWAIGVHRKRLVKIVHGTGAGQLAVISDNTQKSLLIEGVWSAPIGVDSAYRIFGYDFYSYLARETTLAKIVPIAKAAIFNAVLPAAEANWLSTDIIPTNSPSYLRIYACVTVAGVLRVARTVGGVTITEDLNSGGSLVANAAHMFTVPWRVGDGINTRYSATTGTIKRLLIDEIGGAE